MRHLAGQRAPDRRRAVRAGPRATRQPCASDPHPAGCRPAARPSPASRAPSGSSTRLTSGRAYRGGEHAGPRAAPGPADSSATGARSTMGPRRQDRRRGRYRHRDSGRFLLLWRAYIRRAAGPSSGRAMMFSHDRVGTSGASRTTRCTSPMAGMQAQSMAAESSTGAPTARPGSDLSSGQSTLPG